MVVESFTFVDLETTGLSSKTDRIIEIGVVKVKNNKIIKVYETLVNPKMRISPVITQITGINQKSLWSAPSFRQIMQEVYSLLKDGVFVAHNVLFDYRFLQNEFERYGYEFNRPYFCTAKLSRDIFPEYKRHNLDSIIERFSIECGMRHRALSDAKVLWNFIQILQKSLGKRNLQKKLSSHIKNTL